MSEDRRFDQFMKANRPRPPERGAGNQADLLWKKIGERERPNRSTSWPWPILRFALPVVATLAVVVSVLTVTTPREVPLTPELAANIEQSMTLSFLNDEPIDGAVDELLSLAETD